MQKVKEELQAEGFSFQEIRKAKDDLIKRAEALGITSFRGPNI